jgi:hypothetical protein
MMRHSIEWVDRGGEPHNPPNSAYPHGIDLDFAADAKCSCLVNLPYPTAKRLGMFLVKCSECGLSAAITTAGRPDDPRSVKLACKQRGAA